MKKKEVKLSDFTPETQAMLRQFGVSEDLDIAEDFNRFMKKTYGSDVNMSELINHRIREFKKTVSHVEKLINEM